MKHVKCVTFISATLLWPVEPRLDCIFDGITDDDVTRSKAKTNKYHKKEPLDRIVKWAYKPLLNTFDKTCRTYLKQDMSRLMTKPTKWHVRPAKTQISLGILPVWSESSLSAWRKPRLFWVFAGRKVILLVLSWGGSYSIGNRSSRKQSVWRTEIRFQTCINLTVSWF